ncbi:rplA family protein [Pseudomonas syringae]|nr:rplA family protein [Pseudomonas syringae pv. dysoxyli]RVU51811.1 rplA family protein [Pseudomonas syringae pv. syringae]TFZ37435.1 rplA family protein [Pseudomonas syringae]
MGMPFWTLCVLSECVARVERHERHSHAEREER